ncbi:MAG: ABC transporter ATP-binding protein [Synergistaceae bacterium]|nr:ABC transporter ATP-binding protein [Synergistaceae bacterium]
MLEIKNLCYTYPDNHEALKGVSFVLHSGEKVALVGANGSGKSTLLLHVAGAFDVQSGEILLDGQENSELLRKRVGLIFQESDDQLLMPSVIEDTAFNLIASGMKRQEAHEIADEILKSLGIAHLRDRAPHKLSGGEKRLVTFAGVLASSPDILALDEPTAGLDPRARRRVINFLRESEKAILLASHDLDMTLEICSRAIILNDGRVSAEGKLPELFMNKSLLESNGLELPLSYANL